MPKTIVGVGCSHVFGSYLNENNLKYREECWPRSWVHKMQQRYYPDGTSVNLGAPGGSNQRSLRVIKNYVIDNLENAKDMIVIFGITDASRFELVTTQELSVNGVNESLANKNYTAYAVGTWFQFSDKYLQTYLDIHYGVFYNDEYVIEQTSMDMLTLHTFLKNYSIEHYFLNVIVSPDLYNNTAMWNRMPLIRLGGNVNMIEYARKNGYKVGRDIHPDIDCNHLDHDGNEFLATKIYNEMKEIKKWNTI